MIITIDGKVLTAQEGQTILDVAKKANIEIPSLCHREWAEPHGSCRMCSVEITKKSWDGWCKVVTACNHPAQDGLIVFTASERILKLRTTLVDLLLARCPNTEFVQKLAAEYGIQQSSYVLRAEPDDCILCGLCVRACETMGANAISTIQRGIDKEVQTPFDGPNDDCIGCASCAQVCPTNHIKFKEENGVRHIWKKSFPMVKCKECGRAHITEAQLEHTLKKVDLPRSYFDKCEICHRKETAENFFKLSC